MQCQNDYEHKQINRWAIFFISHTLKTNISRRKEMGTSEKHNQLIRVDNYFFYINYKHLQPAYRCQISNTFLTIRYEMVSKLTGLSGIPNNGFLRQGFLTIIKYQMFLNKSG